MRRILLLILVIFSSYVVSQEISKTKWSIKSFSSQEISGEGTINGRAACIIDGDINTFWHSNWTGAGGSTGTLPYEIQIDLGDSVSITGVKIWPRQHTSAGGKVLAYQLYVSADGTTWGTAAATGNVAWTACSDLTVKTIAFTAKGRYLKFRQLSTYASCGGASIASMGELGVTGVYLTPTVTASFSNTSTTTSTNVTHTFTDASTAFKATITNWTWSFPGGTPSSYVGKTPPAVTYTTHGVYPVTLTVADATGTITNSLTKQVSAYISSQVSPELNKGAWSILKFSSQEASGEGSNGFANLILDGNVNTYWHSQYSGSKQVQPHEIQVDLGDTATINGFKLWPRQSNQNGKIANFSFYTSTDGVNWGTPAITSTMLWASANDNNPQLIAFTAIKARYVRIVALSTYPAGDAQVNCIGELGVCGVYNRTFVKAYIGTSSVVSANDITYTFTDKSVANGTTITAWNWSFPGGTPSSYSGKTPPAVKYTTVGNFQASLTVSDGNGLSSLRKTSVNIYGKDPVLYYTTTPNIWSDNLPIGNGDLGAMVYGGIVTDSLLLNEKTVWTGYANDRDNAKGASALAGIRTMFFNGDFAGGQTAVNNNMMGPDYSGDGKYANQPLGKLYITHDGHTTINTSNYRRELNLATAIASVNYDIDETSYKREFLSTAVDNVIAVKYTASNGTKLSMNFKMTREGNYNTCVSDATAKTITMTEHTGIVANPSIGGVTLECLLKIANTGGTVTQVSSRELRVAGADSLVVYITGATDRYKNDQHARNLTAITAATSKTYETLRNAHIAEYQQYYNRAQLTLDATKFITKTIPERITAIKAGGKDNQLINTFFQYGRYMLINSSRPTNILPANLQGIWTEKLNSPWNADFHTNINLQMNYWPAEVTNLSDVHQPMLTLMDSLLRRGQITAKKVFGCNGAVFGHATDIWYMTSPIGGLSYGFWPLGSGWCATHLWEHYLFTKDKNWLATKGYPVLKQYAMFYADYLCKNPATGKLVSGPSVSPENSFKLVAGGPTYNLCMGPACDQEIITELFKACIDASAILNTDQAFATRLQNKVDSLAPLKIGTDGRLLEWDGNYVETEVGHRHSSHLWGFYPGKVITQATTPTLYAAARKSLDTRVANGMVGTEWSRAYAVNYYARFKEPQLALDQVYGYLKNSVLTNLWGNYQGMFQIDGNFGTTAGIAEMLIQSHQGFVEVLPAKPADWRTGSYKGLCARGGFVVDADWENDSLKSVNILSKQGETLKLNWKGRSITIPTAAGLSYVITLVNKQLVYTDPAASVKRVKQNDALKLYPNPTDKKVSVTYNATGTAKVEIELLDFNGKVMYSTIVTNNNGFTHDLNTSILPKGTNFVRIRTDNTVISKKLIIK